MKDLELEEILMNIAVFASHGGSDLQAIIDGCKSNKIEANVAVVISNNGDSMALQRAKNEKIPSYHLSAKKAGSEEAVANEIIEVLSKYNIEMIFLAGDSRKSSISGLKATPIMATTGQRPKSILNWSMAFLTFSAHHEDL